MTQENRITAWHFLPEDGVPRWNYSRKCYTGQTLTAKGPLVLCENGLHASHKAMDALWYAPGAITTRCELWGEVIEGGDKLVARHRKIIALADATDTLHEFACWSALQVIHLWAAPGVVKQYLETRDESLRAAARAAARDATWAAAWAAARAAARAAAWAAARAAARDAAGDAAWAAARAAAGDAAGAAAWAAARDAAGDAARAAAGDALNKKLEQMLTDLLTGAGLRPA